MRMRSRLIRTAVPLIVVALGAGLSGATRSSAAIGPGLVIAGLDAKVSIPNAQPGTAVVDGNGAMHLLTFFYEPRRREVDVYRYYSRQPGKKLKVASVRHVPGDVYVDTATVLSLDGKHVFGVIATCRGVWTMRASIKGTSMSAPVEVAPSTMGCHPPEYPVLVGAVAMPNGRIAVSARFHYEPKLYVGRPGTFDFVKVANQPPIDPTGDIGWSTLTRDPSTGNLVFVSADYASKKTDTVWATIGRSKTGWSPRQDVASVPATLSHQAQVAIAADHGRIAIVANVAKPASSGGSRVLLIDGDESGSWQVPVMPPVMTARDSGAVPAFAPSGALTLAYVHPVKRGRRIETTRQRNRGWSTPKSASGKRVLWLDGLTFMPKGRPVVSYAGS